MNCPICKTENCNSLSAPSGTYGYRCIRCGEYCLTFEAENDYSTQLGERGSASISRWIRSSQGGSKPLVLDWETIEELKSKIELPNPQEQVENIIYWIGQNQNRLSSPVSGKPMELLSLFGCINFHDLHFLLYYMKDSGLLQVAGISEKSIQVSLTMNGWELYEKLRKSNVDSKLVFIAMSYKNLVLADIFVKVIKVAVQKTGFEIRRLDEKPQAGSIDDRLRVEIRRSKFLIADLTDGNQGAYWEAGFAEGLGMPVIYICKKSVFEDKTKPPHFDTNHHLTVIWENTGEGLKKFADELKAVIRNTFPSEAKMDD